MHDNYYRLDMATACMGTGYVGKNVSRPGGSPSTAYPERKRQIAEHGTLLPLDWDEYHCGDENVRNWLGAPLAAPRRLTDHLRPRKYPIRADRSSAELTVSPGYAAQFLEPTRDDSLRVQIDEVQPWHKTTFKIRLSVPVGEIKKGREYTLRFQVQCASPYARVDAKYASIPANLAVRFVADGTMGLDQETLVFETSREIFLTLTGPADGAGTLEFGLGEEPGVIDLSSITLYEGCGDIMARRFENGLVLLNGSSTLEHVFDLDKLFPGEKYRRLRGQQDPRHNSGEIVDASLKLEPRDGIMLRRVSESP